MKGTRGGEREINGWKIVSLGSGLSTGYYDSTIIGIQRTDTHEINTSRVGTYLDSETEE